MKKFRCTFKKTEVLKLSNNTPAIFAEQIILTDCEKIEIPVPAGFDLIAVIEILPEIKILKHDDIEMIKFN